MNFFDSGFFPPEDSWPEAYEDLVGAFGGALQADAWLEAWIAYATAAQMDGILDAAQALGSAAVVLAYLRAKPLIVDTNFAMALQPPMRIQDDIDTFALLPDGAISVETI